MKAPEPLSRRPDDPTICGKIMDARPGDANWSIRYCPRTKADGQELCAVHLGHEKRRRTFAQIRRNRQAARRDLRR